MTLTTPIALACPFSMLRPDIYIYICPYSPAPPFHNVQFPLSSPSLSMCTCCILTDYGSVIPFTFFPFSASLLKYFPGDPGRAVV